MKRKSTSVVLLLFFYLIFINNVQSQVPIDVLVFGNTSNESSHSLTSNLSETYTGDLNQTARRFLPQSPVYYYGGDATFIMKVDPNAQNYFTVKLSGNEYRSDSENGRVILKVEGKEVGLRHGADEELLVEQSGASLSPGAFVFRTVAIPKHLTLGKATVSIKLQSTGRYYYYGTVWNYDSYQRNLLYATRGVYRAYTHINPVFTLPSDDVQGSVSSYSGTAKRTTPGVEIYTTIKQNVINHVTDLMTRTATLRYNGNNYYNDMEYLALAYGISYTPAYNNAIAINKIVSSLDENCKIYVTDNTDATKAWGGAYGRMGYALYLVWNQVSGRMSEIVDFGAGSKSRKDYYVSMFKASLDFGRANRRSITNQDLEGSQAIYGANQALLKLDATKALTETEARRYLREAVGLDEWRGSYNFTTSTYKYEKGRGFYMMTTKGTSHEPGWVSQDCYGNLGPKMVEMYKQCGDAAILQKAVNFEKTQSYFRYPLVNSGYKAILTEGVICWRNAYQPGKIFYGCPWTAAESNDATLMGYQKQFIDDGQFWYVYNSYGTGWIIETKSLYFTLAYDKIGSSSLPIIQNPCTSGRPDYAKADEQNGVLAIKHNTEMVFIMLYRRAYAINYLAKAHQITPQFERMIDFYVDDVRFTPSGTYKTRDGLVQPVTSGIPPDNPESAYTGIQQPVPLLENGETANLDRCIARFYGCTFGEYYIGMNCSNAETNSYSPSGYAYGTDMVSGSVKTFPVSISAQTTMVFHKDNLYRSAFTQIEGESYDSMSGIQTETCSEGGKNVAFISNGDYIVFNRVDFGVGAASFNARVASASTGGVIEVRLDSPTGNLIGSATVPTTGGWQNWQTVSCLVNSVSGVHNLYLIFTGETGNLFNLNWFTFVQGSGSLDGTYKIVAKNSNKALEVAGNSLIDGAAVQQWIDNGGANQQWVITKISGNDYKVVNLKSGKAMDVIGNSTANGAKIEQRTYSGTDNSQIWTITDNGDGSFKIIGKASIKSLDVTGNSTADGALMEIWPYSGNNNQRFIISRLKSANVDIETIENIDVKLYPNPVSDEVNILLSGNFADGADMNIYNNLGKLVLTQKIYNESSFSMKGLPAGVYSVLIHNVDRRITKKIMKN